VIEHRERMSASGELSARRRAQQVKWMWAMLEERVQARLKSDASVRAKLPKLEAAVAEGKMSPAVAVEEIAALLGV
jgi:LAO/AO transport system kinase